MYPYRIIGTLVEHWDGTSWEVVPSPNLEPVNELNGVAMGGPSDVWAIGYTNRAYTDNIDQTLVERFTTCPTPAPPCPNERFTDVCPTDYFYPYVQALAHDNILSGYNSSPPCPNSLWIPCFNPYNSSTRGQISKVVSLAAGFGDPVSSQTFEDVPPGSTFYTYTERLFERGIVSGYPCGGAGEPCIPPGNRPYFRTNRHVTRGQLSKMISLAFGWNDPPVGQNFEDVLPGSTFYTYVAQLHDRNIIAGYPCGGRNEPCVPPDNLPYFRPNNDVTRGQTAKIVQLARTQPTPTPTQTISSSSTPSTAPACCSGVTASINGYCQGAQYWYDYTITNSCQITVTANGGYAFEVAPTMNGPWQARIVGDCFSCTFPPGATHYSGPTAWSGPLPPGMNWWRTDIGYSSVDGCWRFDVASTPQPACVLATMTPSPTPASTSAPTVTVAATQTPINPDCQGIPAAQDMQISPGNCEPAGMDFSIMGSGFQPGEDVRIIVTMPDGTLLGAPYILHADNSGDAGPATFYTEPSNPTGLWRTAFEGQTSQHQAKGPFMLLPPQERRK